MVAMNYKNYDGWSIELVKGSYPVKIKHGNWNTFLIKQDNEWYYLSHDMGGSQLTKVVGMIEWIDKEYKIKTREEKLKRILK
jgi:hypothetical protein